MLQDWDLFEERTDIEEYAGSDLGYINFCTENVLTLRTIKVFPWIDSNVRTLLKEQDAAQHRGNSRKFTYKQHIEDQFDNNPCSMWNGIKALMDDKPINLSPSDDAKLSDVLNQLFTRIDTQRGGSAPLINPTAGESTGFTAPPGGDHPEESECKQGGRPRWSARPGTESICRSAYRGVY